MQCWSVLSHLRFFLISFISICGSHVSHFHQSGQAYHDGRGVEKDFVKALEWFKKSAGLGSKRAHYLIGTFLLVILPKLLFHCRHAGQMFEKAEGVSQDYQEAMRWYKKAAGMNNPTAQKYAGAPFLIMILHYSALNVYYVSVSTSCRRFILQGTRCRARFCHGRFILPQSD